jgi:hypothetical protein
VAEPLRALMAEVERDAQAPPTPPTDLAAVSARWAPVKDAIRAIVRARIAEAQARAPKPCSPLRRTLDHGSQETFIGGAPGRWSRSSTTR